MRKFWKSFLFPYAVPMLLQEENHHLQTALPILLIQKAIEVFGIMYRGVSLNVYLFSAAINAFCKGGRIEDALGLFTRMEELIEDALGLFTRMEELGVAPNVFTFNTIIHGLYGKLEGGLKLKEDMIKQGIQPSNNIYRLLLHGVCNTGKLEEAIKLWDESKRSALGANVYTFGVIIDGYCKADKIEEGEKLFNELISTRLEPDSAIYNTLINAYCKNGNIAAAFRLRDDMRSRCIPPTAATYSCFIHGLCKLGLVEDAQ
ncbi:hypothetical protein LWI29_015686 [Acer saccharum]|uniref:Pentatricopeptide repeat-containing protein n=1 Tax=Acer saccharum TaxID=4024 RepID=A0AA39SEG7_ACESA|nr:hypothetical protein LWI29_015686 [Acer saccharum]